MRIPLTPEDFTAEWLNEALWSSGSLSSGTVSSVKTSSVGEGAGLLGSLARLRVTYDGNAGGAPQSLIAKFPAVAEFNRNIARDYRVYEREYRFYDQLAGSMPLRVPGHHFIDLDKSVGDAVILLEDLHPAEVGDQLNPPGDVEVGLVVDAMADLHAAWWGNADDPNLSWVPYMSDLPWTNVEASFAGFWPAFKENLGHTLNARLRAIGDDFTSKIPLLLERVSKGPATLIHADCRLDNLFFGSGPGQDELVVIDWQLMSRARGTYDIAYFLGQSIEPERRASIEMDLLRRYHSRLGEKGITDYSFEECLDDYRVTILLSMIYPVSAGGGIELANERGVALATAMATRCFAAIEHLNADQVRI